MTDSNKLPFIAVVDTETTGLSRAAHEIFEIAVIKGDPYADGSGYKWKECVWHLEVDLTKADPGALRVNNLYQRLSAEESDDTDYLWKVPHFHSESIFQDRKRSFRNPQQAAYEVASALASRTVLGAVPDFDAYRLEDWLRANGQCGAWDYHLVDVETLVAGYLRGLTAGMGLQVDSRTLQHVSLDGFEFPGGYTADQLLALSMPRWRSTELLAGIGVQPPQGRHTALADCRWARDAYCKVFNVPV